jgi:endonuclease-3
MAASEQPGRSEEGQLPPDKEPFDLGVVLRQVRAAVRPYPKAALFELADLGHRSVFEILVACIVSIRTRDETTLPVAKRLLEQASTPAAMLALTTKEIDGLIASCTFHRPKAATIHAIARQAVEVHGGELPCDPEPLLAMKGVGPKCAHLALGIACGQPFLGVDIHVHRVTNRWGYVSATTPEKTMVALEEKLPQRYWVEINKLLVPFGKHICTGSAPHCSTCPVLSMCQQVGVTRHR